MKTSQEAAAKTLAIIKREQDRSFWRRLNSTCDKERSPPPTSVQVEGSNGTVTKHNTKKSVNNAIWTDIHHKWFHLAEEAPVCQGQLCQDLEYNAVSKTARAILDGTYEYPVSFDQATKELCQECALIRQIVPKDSVRIQITKEDHKGHWQKAKEETFHQNQATTLGITWQDRSQSTSTTSTLSRQPFSSITA
jgi:hypothetical protein